MRGRLPLVAMKAATLFTVISLTMPYAANADEEMSAVIGGIAATSGAALAAGDNATEGADDCNLDSPQMSGGGGGRAEDSAKAMDIAKRMAEYYKSKGATKAQAAGMMGNAKWESGLDPARGQIGGGGGFGLYQWTPREKIAKWAQKHQIAKPDTDLDLQLAMSEEWLHGKDWGGDWTVANSEVPMPAATLWESFRMAIDYRVSTIAFLHGAERGDPAQSHWPTRIQYAQEFSEGLLNGMQFADKPLPEEGKGAKDPNHDFTKDAGSGAEGCSIGSAEYDPNNPMVSIAKQIMALHYTYPGYGDSRTDWGTNPVTGKLLTLPDDLNSPDKVKLLKPNGKVDCSAFVSLVLSLAGAKLPYAVNTVAMEQDAQKTHKYLMQINEDQAKPGDILLSHVNNTDGNGALGHVMILETPSIGDDKTMVINSGGNGNGVNEDTVLRSIYSYYQGGKRPDFFMFARPVGINKTVEQVKEETKKDPTQITNGHLQGSVQP